MKLAIVACAAILSATSAVAADLPAASTPSAPDYAAIPAPPRAPVAPSNAVSLSLVRVVSLVAEVQYERQLAPAFGVAVLAFAGSASDSPSRVEGSKYGIGAQARWYLLGDFRSGLLLAADVRYQHSTARWTDVPFSAHATGNLLSLGAWLGGKLLLGERVFVESGIGAAWNRGWSDITWSDGVLSQELNTVRILLVLGVGVCI